MSRGEARYRVPAQTTMLGSVLDVTIEHDGRRAFVTEWRGWLMLCGLTAMDAAPGRARLYLMRGELEPSDRMPSNTGAATYERWHRRNPEQVGIVDNGGPDEIGFYQGRAIQLGYRSDKWGRRGRTHDYDHNFYEDRGDPPRIYTDRATLQGSSAAVLVGGSMSITERGIA